jgi:hypothetical protein
MYNTTMKISSILGGMKKSHENPIKMEPAEGSREL